jgi:hypothetical protein
MNSNEAILASLLTQRDLLRAELTQPLSEKYAELLFMCEQGEVFFRNDQKENAVADIRRGAADRSQDTLFIDFIEKTIVDEQKAVRSFRKDLACVFAEIRERDDFPFTGAIMMEYGWYYHYSSSLRLMKNGFVYPVVTEPRYLNEFDLSQYGEIIGGPAFTDAFPDCEEVENEAQILEMGDKLMSYYELNARVLLHNALKEMDTAGELAFLPNRPFVFYINEHDSEVMSLFVKDECFP